MSSPSTFLGSTIGRKLVMAVTGVVLFGFVVLHMAGNLQLYLGAGPMNEYGRFLHEMLHGGGLWIARGVLLGAVGLHAWAAASLTMTAADARPVGYRELRAAESTYASRSMGWSGVLLAAFVVYHLFDLTFGTANPGFVAGEPYRNVVASFSRVPVALVYVGAMCLLGLHLKHGALSMLRTLGMSHPHHEVVVGRVLTVVVAVTIAANVSFPLAVLAGVVR